MNETILTDALASRNPEKEQIGREMLAGYTGTAFIKLDGKPVYTFYTSIPHIGWSVGNVCPPNIILKELDTISKNIIIVSLASMLILFFIVYIIIRRLVNPLAQFYRPVQCRVTTGIFA